MPKFQYKAIDNTGKVIRGTLFTLSAADVEENLLQRGLTLIKSKPIKEGLRGKLAAAGKIKPRLLIEFYHRLSQTLEMGLPLLSALEENAKILPSKFFSKVIIEVKVAIEGGRSLHEAMGRYPKVFNKLDLAIIRLGEQSGVLPKSMKDLADFLEWKEDIRSTIKRATIYPSFIILVIIAVIGVWVGYVLPQMAILLKEMGVALPQVTRMVLNTSLFFQKNWLWILVVFLAVFASLFLAQKTKKGGILFHRFLLEVPIIGAIARNIALARLSHNFATMYQSGMTINNIFEILTDDVLGNRYLEARLKRAFQEIQRGQPIAGGFEAAGGFPPLLLGAIKNGEMTGTLDSSFNRLGDYYDGEVKRTVQAMVNALEPLTTIFLGGVFAIIVLSIMLPLYDVIGQFK
ncbi:MAG: type II secretion system F family protein [Proteobacteria bacterium]|nr:type II secretion system F family protein [Pseudomonadota bacterium]